MITVSVVPGYVRFSLFVVVSRLPIRVPPSRESLLRELLKNGVKHTPEDVARVAKDATGKVVSLENGTAQSGLKHILDRHARDFATRGIPEAQVPDAVIKAVSQGKVVGQLGSGRNVRSVYEVELQGKAQRIAVGVSSNGYIVTAHPANST